MPEKAVPNEAEPPRGCVAPIRTYSLDEVAAMVLPPDLKCPRRWLAERLNQGEIQGYKVGRTWRMTHEDVEDLIAQRRNPPRRVHHELGSSLTETSRRRLAGNAPAAPSSLVDGLTPRGRRRLINQPPNAPL